MRYITSILVAGAIIAVPAHYALAQTTKPSVTKTASPSAAVSTSPTDVAESEIQDLKEKIATKVAELRKNNQKATAGMIASIKDKTIAIKTNDDGDYDVKVDDALTKIYNIISAKKEIKLTDLTKGSYIIVSGPLVDKTIDANTIYQDEEFIVKSGKITEVNKTDFSLKVTTTAKDSMTVDIENGTSQSMLDIKTLELSKIGFSKIKEGDTIHFTGRKSTDPKDQSRVKATKILIIPQEYFQK